MELTAFAMMFFVGVATTIAAGGMLMRDLIFGRSTRSAERSKSGKFLLPRLPNTLVAPQGGGAVANIDRGFHKLVVETGMDATPWGALLLMIACGLMLGGAVWIMSLNELWTGVAAVIGVLMPLPYLVYRRAKRLREIREQLPNILDLLARALRAGESLDQAISLAGEKGGEPLAKEFRRCASHLKMGLSLPATMRSLMNRAQIMEMKIFATTLAVHRQTGGNLATTLERMAVVVRDRLTYQRQLRATMSAGRFSAFLVAATGPLLFAFMFLFQRSYVERLLVLPIGQGLLILAMSLEIAGLVWIFRLLRTEY